MVLGRAGFSVADLCGVFRILPEGAAVETLMAVYSYQPKGLIVNTVYLRTLSWELYLI